MNSRPPSDSATTAAVGATRTVAALYASWRERFIRPMLVGGLILAPLVLLPALLANPGIFPSIVLIAAYLLLGILILVQIPYPYRLAGFLVIIYALGITELLATGVLGNAIFFFLGFVLFASLMGSPQAGTITAAINLVTLAVAGLLVQNGSIILSSPEAMPGQAADWVAAGAKITLFSAVIVLAFRQVELEFAGAQSRVVQVVSELEHERGSQEERVSSRTNQLRAVNEVGRTAGSILDPNELIARVVNVISDRLGYYYAALFLVNEAGDEAELRGATGEAGRLLMQNKHHLRVGGSSMVGMAIATGQPRIAAEPELHAVRFQNPLLPYTRSELALPLVIGERALGALDVHSTKVSAFGPHEIETLQSMASGVAIAYENARLFQNSTHSLEELQAVQRQYILDAWTPLNVSPDLRYEVGDDDVPPGSRGIDIPLALRDEIIGQISVAGEHDWTADERTFIEAVATQAALALENARLVEASQSSAMQEHLLADITGKVWAATSIDGILRAAVGELGQALGASEATIEFGVDDGRQ